MRLSIRRGGAIRPDFWTGWRLVDRRRRRARARSRRPLSAFDAASGRLRLDGLASTPAGWMRPTSCAATWKRQLSRFAICWDFRWQSQCRPLYLRLGTTRGTNALITRRGARTALVTTRGFGDVLEIGYQARPRLFDLTVRKPPVLTTAVVEIDERVTHDGQVLVAPNEAAVRQQLQSLVDAGIESLAICLLHADRHQCT